MSKSFHIKDYPSREAQWVAALTWWKKTNAGT